MDIILNKIRFSDGSKGVVSLSPNIENKEAIIKWIIENKFNSFTKQEYRMQRHTRKRNKLYSFQHPIQNTEVILKVSSIDKQYPLLRRVNLILSTLFSDYNFRAFKGSIELRNIDISCANPIAYWTQSYSIFKKKSYYLYEKINADHSLFSFSQTLLQKDRINNDEIFHRLAAKTTDIIRLIHNAGFRQGDPHPGNFLIATHESESKHLSIDEINSMRMFIIDLDKFCRAKPFGRTIKRFFDLRCMRRCTLGPYNQHEMLKLYLLDEYSSAWGYVLSFWIRGGFNPYKWFKAPKRGR